MAFVAASGILPIRGDMILCVVALRSARLRMDHTTEAPSGYPPGFEASR